MNKSLIKIHRYIGVAIAIPFVIIAVTGSILAFRQAVASLMVEGYALPSQYISMQPQRLSLDALVKQVKKATPEFEIATWEVFHDYQTADRLYMIKLGTNTWFKANLDPYSGHLLRQPEPFRDDFTDWIEEFHYNFSLETAGVMLSTFVALGVLFLGGSGIYVHRYRWKRLWTWRSANHHRAHDKTLDPAKRNAQHEVNLRHLHKLSGLWAAPILLIVGFTGLYFNILILLHELTEDDAHHHAIFTQKGYADSIQLQSLLEQTQAQIPQFTLTYIALAYEDALPISFYGDVPTANPLTSQYASGASYDAHSGEQTLRWDIRQLDILTTVLDTFRRLHFGNFAGNASAAVWAIIGFAPLILGWSGINAWLRARRKAQAK